MTRLEPLRTPSRARGRRLLASAILLSVAVALLASPFLVGAAFAADETPAPTAAEQPWSEGAVDAWSITPVQQGGRAMPLYTWANYALLRVNHKKSCKTPSGRKIKPVEWMLDAMFRPELARTYRCFRIETDEVLTAAGLDIEGRKKADRYSYDELAPARAKLFALAMQYGSKAEKNRTRVEGALVALAHGVREFEGLIHFLDFARDGIPASSAPDLAKGFEGKDRIPTSAGLVPLAPKIRQEVVQLVQGTEGRNPDRRMGVDKALEAALKPYDGLARMFEEGHLLSLFPLTRSQFDQLKSLHERKQALSENPEAWLSPTDLLARTVLWPNLEAAAVHVEMLGLLESMNANLDDLEAFEKHATEFQARGKELATGLGQYEGIESEVTYLKTNLLGWAKHFFLLALMLVAVSWLRPWRWLTVSAWTLTAILSVVVVVAIWWRCVLRGRPPVTTLYETVIFITGCMVVAGVVVEWINKQKIALALTPILGWAGLAIAERYELTRMEDTMPQLVAVLDTNFWLALHVTCIAIGYAASLLTGAVAHVYVLGKVVGFKKGDPGFYRTVGRMVYGILAFALIFATVGTILGGIWANESWGRFWGWDPKENGALMIVLWQLAMIHMRLGGYIKNFGLCMSALVLNIIVAFSWWGVNLLGIGLHSYGFTAGIANSLRLFYLSQVVVFLLGAGWWLFQKFNAHAVGSGPART